MKPLGTSKEAESSQQELDAIIRAPRYVYQNVVGPLPPRVGFEKQTPDVRDVLLTSRATVGPMDYSGTPAGR